MNREVAQEQVLRDVARLLRRQKWVIIATTLVAVGAAILYSASKTKEYQASAQIQFVDQSQYLSTLGLGTPFVGQTPAQEASQGAERLTSPPVVDAVSKDVKSNLTKSQIKDAVSTSVSPDSALVAVTVKAKSATLAADLANAYATETKNVLTAAQRSQFLDQAASLSKSSRGLPDTSVQKQTALQDAARLRSLAKVATPVELANPATVPGSPVSPKPVRDSILALVLGLIFGTLLAFLRDSFDRRLTDPHDVQHHMQIPMLGYVDEDSLGGLSGNGSAESDVGLEPFRILRANVEFLGGDKRVRTLAVTSPLPEEGKSTVAAGLAMVAALAGRRVLLVECDLRRPVFAARFDIPESPGLADWIAGNAKPADVIQPVALGGVNGADAGDKVETEHLLTVISAGSFSPEPAEVLASERFAEFIEQVSSVYDLVVFDCAPLLPVGDTLEVLPFVDAGLLCIRLEQTTREQALAAKTALDHLPERPLGLVLTGLRPGREGYYYGYYSSTSGQPAIVVQPPSG